MQKTTTSFFLISLFFCVNAYSKIYDFGVQGAEYNITEVDYRVVLKKRLHDLNKTKLKNDIYESIDNLLISEMDIGQCLKDSSTKSEYFVKAPQDVELPNGKFLIRKGQKITIPKDKHLPDAHFCIVDGKDEDEMVNDINSLFSIYGKECVFVLNNYSIKKFKKNYPTVKRVYLLNKQFIKSFHLDCYPAHIGLVGSYIYHDYYNFKELGE